MRVVGDKNPIFSKKSVIIIIYFDARPVKQYFFETNKMFYLMKLK